MDGEKVVWWEVKSVFGKIDMHSLVYYIFLKDKGVHIIFGTIGVDDVDKVDQLFASNIPLFHKIINSIVIDSE